MSMGRVFKTRLRRWGVKHIREISTEFAIINEYSARVNKMKVVAWPTLDVDEGDGGGDDNDDIDGGAVNSGKQIHAIVDGKAMVISASSVRSDLLFNDEDGIAYVTNAEIFENLALMGYEQISTKLTF
nr:hypothetical protein [Tanacetum cinerariifolium]